MLRLTVSGWGLGTDTYCKRLGAGYSISESHCIVVWPSDGRVALCLRRTPIDRWLRGSHTDLNSPGLSLSSCKDLKSTAQIVTQKQDPTKF